MQWAYSHDMNSSLVTTNTHNPGLLKNERIVPLRAEGLRGSKHCSKFLGRSANGKWTKWLLGQSLQMPLRSGNYLSGRRGGDFGARYLQRSWNLFRRAAAAFGARSVATAVNRDSNEVWQHDVAIDCGRLISRPTSSRYRIPSLDTEHLAGTQTVPQCYHPHASLASRPFCSINGEDRNILVR